MRCSDAYFFVVACSFSAYCFAIFVSLCVISRFVVRMFSFCYERIFVLLCVISRFVVNGFFDVDLFLLCF